MYRKEWRESLELKRKVYKLNLNMKKLVNGLNIKQIVKIKYRLYRQLNYKLIMFQIYFALCK